MCVEKEGDGKAILEEVLAQSFISSCIRLLPIYLSPQAAERLDVFPSEYLLFSGSASLMMFTSPSFSSIRLSLMRMDDGECAASNSEHRSLLHWHR